MALKKKLLVKKLSLFEKSILELLMQHPNEVVKKDQLAEKLWGHSFKTQNIASLNNIYPNYMTYLKILIPYKLVH